MNPKIRTAAVDYLFDAIMELKDKEECYIFFEDICTINELLSLSQRFEVASMLREKKTYLEIAEHTGASTATISRVNRSLNYGNDGYDMVLTRMESKKKRIDSAESSKFLAEYLSDILKKKIEEITDSSGIEEVKLRVEYANGILSKLGI